MAILSVGAGKQYTTIPSAISAAQDGDTIQVAAGTYTNQYAQIPKNITLEGVGGMVNMVSTGLIPNGKAIFITSGNIMINNFEFSGAKVYDANGAGIRYEGGNLVLNKCYFHNNEDGLLGGSWPTGTLTINNSEFAYNGRGDGQTHNLYIGKIANLTVDNSYFHDANVGHEIKSRALTTTIKNSRIYDLNGTASYSIDLPNGGNSVIQNNVIEQGPLSQNPIIVSYGVEGNLNPSTSLLVIGNTILNDKISSSSLVLKNTTTTPAQITSNSFFGLTSSQIAYGPSVQTGNQFLATEPQLNTTHPWSQVALSTVLSIALVSDTGSSASDKITSSPAIKGTGQANTVVTIKEGSTTLGTTAASSTGAWSFAPPVLVDGAHTFTATQTNSAGTTVTATLSFTLDKTAPGLSIALVSDTGSSASDKVTSNPAIKGTGQASTAVTIKEGSTILGTTTTDSTGAWSYTPTSFVSGVHTMAAFQTDLAGNTSTATLSFTLDSRSASTSLVGTEGNDVLTGTVIGHNVIYGLGGNDTISVSYSSATTELYGGDGDDIITGSTWGADYIDGGPGNDNLYGAWGNDIILGGDGNDRIYAGAGDDVLYTGSGTDYVQADYGNDTIYCGPGINQIDGGPGADTAVFAGNHTGYSLSLANGVTTIVGSEGTSSLTNIEMIKFNDGSYNVLTGLFQA